MNKVIDINEWLRWVISLHPSQKQINTIKPYWKCKSKEDYLKVFKNDIKQCQTFINNDVKYSQDDWKDGMYSWDLDRLFDIYKFILDCEQLAKVNLEYFPLNDTLNDNKWENYIQVIAQYNKSHINNSHEYTYRIVMVDFRIFKIYARQSRSLQGEHRYIMHSNSNDEELEKQQNLSIFWDDQQCIFMSINGIKINKDLLKNKKSINLQKEKRLYCLDDSKENMYQLPELYYPENIRTFIDYCINKQILPFSKSIRIWSKTDYYEIYSDPKNKCFKDYMTEEDMLHYKPFPMMNIKTKKELSEYIKERKKKRAYEISKDISKTLTINYSINDIFHPIDLINQDICNEFIEYMNKEKLYEIIQ